MSKTPVQTTSQKRSRSTCSLLEWYAKMYGVYKAMPESEREELFVWEKEYIDGSGKFGTSDWPGWEKYIGPIPQGHLSTSQSTHSGFVYLIQIPTGEYKIGRSIDVGRRLQEFSTSSPHGFHLIYKIVADDMVQAEKQLHNKFIQKSIKGEWFHLTSEDVEYFSRLVSFENGEFVMSST